MNNRIGDQPKLRKIPVRNLIALISLLGFAAPAAAQEEGVPLDVALGFGFSKPLNADCTSVDQRVTVELANCWPVEWSIGGEFAAHVTDHIAPFIQTSWSTSSLDTTAHVHDRFFGSFSLPVDWDASGVTVAGGARVYFQPLSSRTRGYVSVATGFTRGTATFSMLGFDESSTETAFVLSPSSGVEVGFSQNFLMRFSFGLGVGWVGGEANTGVGGSTAFVLRFR